MTVKHLISENSYESVSALFTKRSPDSNKGDFGTAVIIGGSKNYVGAPLFSAESAANVLSALGHVAMLSGAGRSALCVPDFLASALYAKVKYSAIYPLKSSDGNLVFDESEIKNIMSCARVAVAVGMGAGDGDISSFVKYILEKTGNNFVIDADGLKCVCNFNSFRMRAVLTPHIGEFSRLTGKSIASIKSEAAECCRAYAEKMDAVVVLKDCISYISDGRKTYINRTGNVKLAKGGSGDLLSGIICGLLACGFAPIDAARSGSYLLGKCAELSEVNEYSNLPDDTLKMLSTALGQLMK